MNTVFRGEAISRGDCAKFVTRAAPGAEVNVDLATGKIAATPAPSDAAGGYPAQLAG